MVTLKVDYQHCTTVEYVFKQLTGVSVCWYVRVCACARVRVCACARVRVCACARVRVCVVVYVCIHLFVCFFVGLRRMGM